jgi:hypothetical protein
MEVNTCGYAVKASDQIILHTIRATPDKVLEEFSGLLSDSKTTVVQVNVGEVENSDGFSPNKFAFQGFDTTGGIAYFIGDLNFTQQGDAVIGDIRFLNEDCNLVQSFLSKSSLETLYMMESIGSGSGKLYIKETKSFIVTDDGDTTSILQLHRKGELAKVIDTLLKMFYEIGVE